MSQAPEKQIEDALKDVDRAQGRNSSCFPWGRKAFFGIAIAIVAAVLQIVKE